MKTQPRENWDQAFKEMHANGDDQLLIPDVFDDEGFQELESPFVAEV
jgi:antitoxin MazE